MLPNAPSPVIESEAALGSSLILPFASGHTPGEYVTLDLDSRFDKDPSLTPYTDA